MKTQIVVMFYNSYTTIISTSASLMKIQQK